MEYSDVRKGVRKFWGFEFLNRGVRKILLRR